MVASKECVTCEMRSLRQLVCAVFVFVAFGTKVGRWHCFFRGQIALSFRFCSCRVFILFLPPEKQSFQSCKVALSASSDVRSMSVVV